MKVLVINAGSSSLKYQLIDMENEAVLAKGQLRTHRGRRTDHPQNIRRTHCIP